MSTVEVGKPVPDFELPATSGISFRLSDHKGKNVVIYFYPKDNTPGCTSEGQDFRDLYPEFVGEDTEIFGVSRDGLRAHENFRAKYHFPFELLSDPDEKLCKKFDVIREKTLYGRKFMGVERSTFLIDADGKLRQEWRKVKVKGHAAEVLESVIMLNKR